MRTWFFFLVCAVYPCSSVSTAATLKAGEILKIDFSVFAPASCAGGPCDTIWPSVPYASEQFVDNSSAILKAGGVAIATSGFADWWYFRSSSSLFGLGSTANLTPIFESASAGEIDFRIGDGELRGVDLANTVVFFGHAFNSCCFGPNPLTPAITTAEIVSDTPEHAPEPNGWTLVAVAAAFLAAVRRLRNR